jgi:very-short-patch-repair endonuclease
LVCGKKFNIKKYLKIQGFGKYCSRECQFFAYEGRRIIITCKNCKTEFSGPPSVAKTRKFCSKHCKDDYEKDYVARICKNCKKKFLLPRWEINKGKGTFCSRKCFCQFQGETSIEILIRKELEKANINFKQEIRIGKFCIDFLILNKKIVIECDGEYWHSGRRAELRDKRKDKFLKSRGYCIYRFSESEIKASAEDCVKRVL